MVEHKTEQHSQAANAKAKWVDPYHEKDQEHFHEGNSQLLDAR